MNISLNLVPPNMEITYVSVRVNAITPPKVDFDNETKTVSIKYSWLQVPVSSYEIFAKGIPVVG
ncbi:uncharacterized protein LOC125232785 isoform X2 [Leguminivora glycinivorella]|uniref:uncharacterized protein LOC125232785 isoform X2 n=1 Tax=Leguminivora glycinivorella TaxID=1035111 RepID=UPI00200F204E|nr:uncharacterized protein LOC125232785 isoform X2 [Leguminivora glycinivorella]